ncbi:MAG: NAD(P)-binding protein [Nitrospinae bacterium]|nr:NAD(P)-binding protein [Nitrospinota bacterium]
MKEKKIIIIGAGPTGLGAAYKLSELGYENWEIYERNSYVGGLAASFEDDKGFTWDVGGHVLFSHFPYFDEMVDKALKNEYLKHERSAWIFQGKNWIPYPFQNNIRHLEKEQVLECLMGLIALNKTKEQTQNFEELIYAIFGEGIAKYFMIPYNQKVWAHNLKDISTEWIAERMSVINLEKKKKNVVFQQDEVSWGPNNRFKFPLKGGTGAIFNGIAKFLTKPIFFNKNLVECNTQKKVATFNDGTETNYDILINTSPLNVFINNLRGSHEKAQDTIKGVVYNSGLIIGHGVKKKLKSNKCWIYFPEQLYPFYRVTYFSNYSPNNVPRGDTDTYCSIMSEVSYPVGSKVNEAQIKEETVKGLIKSGILEEKERENIVSEYSIGISHSYPVPTIGRNRALDYIHPYLENMGIFSRGRFGGWKYEIGNMDHSTMQGVELINRIVSGEKETVWAG